MSTKPVRLIASFGPPLAVDVPMGSSVRCRVTVEDVDTGQPVAPDGLSLHVRPQYGSLATYAAPTLDVTGSYHQDVVLSAPGKTLFRWLATGNPGAVAVGSATTELSVVESQV